MDNKPLLGGAELGGAEPGGAEPRAASMLDAGEDVVGLEPSASPRRSSAFTVAMERGQTDSWSRFVKRYCAFLARFKVLVMVFWVVLAAVGGFFTPQFLGNTTNEFQAPPGSPSDLAENLQMSLFCPCDPCPCPDDGPDDGGGGGGHHHHHRRLAEQWKDTRRRLQRGPPPPPGNHTPHHHGNHSGGGGGDDFDSSVIIVHNSTLPPAGKNASSIMGEDGKSTVFRKFLQAMNKSFEDENGAGTVASMQSYLEMPPEMQSQFLAKDHSAALVMFNIDFDNMNWGPGGPHEQEEGLRRRLSQALSDAAQTASGVHLAVTRGRRLQGGGGPDGGIDDAIQGAEDATPGSGLKAYEVGMDAFGNDAMNGVDHDLLRMDTVSFPLAFCVMAGILRSLRLLIAPFLCIVVSMTVAFGGVMYPVSLHTDIITFAPAVMMSITLAVSIDYSLFILSRYREEIVLGLTVQDAVEKCLSTAGHTVLVSGTTLAVRFESRFPALFGVPCPSLFPSFLGLISRGNAWAGGVCGFGLLPDDASELCWGGRGVFRGGYGAREPLTDAGAAADLPGLLRPGERSASRTDQTALFRKKKNRLKIMPAAEATDLDRLVDLTVARFCRCAEL